MISPMPVPEIDSVSYLCYAARRWGTTVHFANGVTLAYTGKINEDSARAQAESYYASLINGGWSEEEIQGVFNARTAA